MGMIFDPRAAHETEEADEPLESNQKERSGAQGSFSIWRYNFSNGERRTQDSSRLHKSIRDRFKRFLQWLDLPVAAPDGEIQSVQPLTLDESGPLSGGHEQCGTRILRTL